MTELVIDASAALDLVSASERLIALAAFDLVAPRLMWSEATSVLHEAVWRRDVPVDAADEIRRRLRAAPIRLADSDGLLDLAWSVSERLGWARTYDAEYVALAELLGCDLFTSDLRLARGAARIVGVRTPAEFQSR